MWERQVSLFARYPTLTTKANTALTDFADAFGSTSSSQSLWLMWVSDTLDVDQTITGTSSIVVRGLEAAAADDLHLAYALRVMQGDTTTERGTLITQGATATEFTTSAQTRIFSAQALSSVAALAGDRIAIDIGFHGLTPQSGATGTLRFGDPTGTADFALTSGLTTDLCPWVELSQTLTFGTPAAGSSKFFAFF